MRTEAEHSHLLRGLARECPKCYTIAHYDIEGRKENKVECPVCSTEFLIKKYRRGERPKERGSKC